MILTKELLLFYHIPFYFYNIACLHEFINHVLSTFCIYRKKKKKKKVQGQCPSFPFQSFFFFFKYHTRIKETIRGSNYKIWAEIWSVYFLLNITKSLYNPSNHDLVYYLKTLIWAYTDYPNWYFLIVICSKVNCVSQQRRTWRNQSPLIPKINQNHHIQILSATIYSYVF